MERKEQTHIAISMDLEQCRIADLASKKFNNGEYDACVQYLLQLEITEDTRRRIFHNVAVAEFYKTNLTEHAAFLRHLEELIGEITHVNFIEIRAQSVATLLFNRAIVLYHMKRPVAAWKIIVTLLRFLNIFDAPFVQRIGLLAMELLLNLNQPTKVDDIIELLNARLNLKVDTPSGSDSDEDPDNQKAKAEIKSLEHFRWMYRLYKIRSRIMNGQPIIVPVEESPEIFMLKAHQYYVTHDYQMAAKELTKKPITMLPNFLQHGEEYNTVIANNMGLIHFHVRHYAMAARFFQHALTFDKDAIDKINSNPPLHAVGASKRPEILYNLGIALLHLKRPKDAFECFLIPLSIYHNNPRLWLRLAESCIMVHKENIKSNCHKRVASSVIGSGLHRKYIIHPTRPKYSHDDKGSFAIPATNLEFALLCLRNALVLIEHYENQVNKKESTEKAKPQDINVDFTMSPSKNLTLDSFLQLKYAVLSAYCYVQINLGEYILALKYAKKLLDLSEVPDAYKMLGNLYCAESLIMLDRSDEAANYLQPQFITDLKEDDFIKRASPDWEASSLSAARAILEYNFIVLLVMQGEVEAARVLVGRNQHPLLLTHSKMLTMYLALRTGNIERCRGWIRYDSPHL